MGSSVLFGSECPIVADGDPYLRTAPTPRDGWIRPRILYVRNSEIFRVLDENLEFLRTHHIP